VCLSRHRSSYQALSLVGTLSLQSYRGGVCISRSYVCIVFGKERQELVMGIQSEIGSAQSAIVE